MPRVGASIRLMMRRLLRKLRQGGVRPGPLDVFYGLLDGEELDAAEQVFFSGLQLSNGTFKTTAARRLDDVNDAIVPYLRDRGFVRMNDVAVSSGVATAEWSDHLREHGIPHRFVAGDLVPDGVLLSIGTRMAVLWDRDGYPLALQGGRRSVYLAQNRTMTKVLRGPLRLIFRACGHRARRDGKPAPGVVMTTRVPFVTRRISESEIEVVRDDIFDPEAFREQFDVCRAANILHREYFSEATLRALAHNLARRLCDGGVLVVCRTHEDGSNRMTAFEKRRGVLHVLCQLNGGSDVEEIVLRANGRAY